MEAIVSDDYELFTTMLQHRQVQLNLLTGKETQPCTTRLFTIEVI